MIEISDSEWDAIETSVEGAREWLDDRGLAGLFEESGREDDAREFFEDLEAAVESRNSDMTDSAAANLFDTVGGAKENDELFAMGVHPDANDMLGSPARQVLYLTRGKDYHREF